jgi:DHA2 family multidrug resistance protein
MHGLDLMARLQAGDTAAAMIAGIPPQVFAALPPEPLDVATQVLLAPLLEKAALTAAINDAWLLIAVLTGIALLFLPFARRSVTAPEKHL